ncbi:TasA family protein [Arthrobacter mangrovi]|uniref:Camelysin metallo-endopeptidase n=1 Tax=Arthrobacter mangrovi TaxID=2966350 RepID=A0ABQ5MVD5_9MICC|nr:TasA family protein [Arthrobacter mangrovi]GLB67903.1 hypothetical protein AHIS1636_23430 [Arthrobacter mangrovi]
MGISMKTTSGKLLASAALVATAAAVAGLGTFGEFSGSTNASTDVGTGKVNISLANGAQSGWQVGAAGLLPGDSMQRVATVTNDGTSDLGGLYLTTSASTQNALVDGTANGLQMTIDRCSTSWSGTNSGGYTCADGGTVTSVVVPGAVVRKGVDLGQLAALTHNNSDNLRLTLSLPKDADDTFEGLGNNLTFAFTATQKAGSLK